VRPIHAIDLSGPNLWIATTRPEYTHVFVALISGTRLGPDAIIVSRRA